jgi:hypothetical protein
MTSSHSPGPRRSESVDSYRRETRAIAAVALLALVAGVVSDAFAAHFWGRHPLLTGLASGVIVVMLSIALISEAFERRSRRRWRVLAQHVMIELVGNARLVWTAVMELAGLMPPDAYTTAAIDAGARAVRDTPRLAEAIRELVADGDRRPLLHEEIARFVNHSNDVLGRWAAVLLNADVYAEVVDRHVELAREVAALDSLLDYFEPTDDDGWRRRESRSSPVVPFEGEFDDDWLAERVVAITQLAEQLDRATLELALRIVRVEWWAARHETTAPRASVRSRAVVRNDQDRPLPGRRMTVLTRKALGQLAGLGSASHSGSSLSMAPGRAAAPAAGKRPPGRDRGPGGGL